VHSYGLRVLKKLYKI